MKITHEEYDQLSVIAIRGDLATEGVDDFLGVARQTLGQNVRDFVLDLTGMDFVDSKGLEAMLWLQEQTVERMGQVRLAGASENVSKILEVTRLTPRFDAHLGVDAAIKSLR